MGEAWCPQSEFEKVGTYVSHLLHLQTFRIGNMENALLLKMMLLLWLAAHLEGTHPGALLHHTYVYG